MKWGGPVRAAPLSFPDLLDHLQQGFGPLVFPYEALRTGRLCPGAHRRIVVERQHDDPAASPAFTKRATRGDAIHAWHLDVHNHHVWLESLGLVERVESIGRFADDLEPWLEGKPHTKTRSNHWLIVHEEK